MGRMVKAFRDVGSTSCTEWKSAYSKCKELGGDSYIALSESYGTDQVFCSFGDSMGCTQGELNTGKCFMEKNKEWHSAYLKCEDLGGNPYTALSELYGEDQMSCSFGNVGGCTQGELNDGVCFMGLKPEWKSAYLKCNELGGYPYTALSESYGEDQVFCYFDKESECTQGELNSGKCFME